MKVGPGSYDPQKTVDKKPKSMTVARAGLSKTTTGRLHGTSNGTIKDSFFEEEQTEPLVMPGPGHYKAESACGKVVY